MLFRGKFMIGLAAHWMVGSIYSAGLGWAVIPGHGWRLFLVLASLPAWFSAVGNMLLMPESPRYLLVHGRTALAQKVQARINC
jgi:MFS family permease